MLGRRGRTVVTAAPLAVAVAALVLGSPTVASASVVGGTSPTYAGLVAALPSGGGAPAVDASLLVPKLQCTGGPATARFWAGWGDPVAGGAVVRSGLIATCRGPRASYALVMQWFDPDARTRTTTVDLGKIDAGETVGLGVAKAKRSGWRGTAFVSGCDSAGCWARGVQTPIQRPTGSTAPLARSAGCVVEGPALRRGGTSLADFGTVHWHSCRAEVGADRYVLASDRGSRPFDVTRVKMFIPSDLTRAAVTHLGRRGFAVTWKHD